MTMALSSGRSHHSRIRVSPIGEGTIRCMSASDLLQDTAAGSVGAIITEPPIRGYVDMDDIDLWAETSTIDEMVAWALPMAQQINRVLRPGGSSVVMGGPQAISAWEIAAERAGLAWMAEMIVLWNTNRPRSRKHGCLTTIARWHTKPGFRSTASSRAIHSNVIVCDQVPSADRVHPAQKPVELTNLFVSLFTQEDDLIVDPFCGSGSTLVSAAMCGRPWMGGDINMDLCRVAEVRTKRVELEEAYLRPIYLWVNGRLEPVAG